MLVEEFLKRVPPSVRLYLADKEETDYIKCAKSADTYSLIHRLTPSPPPSKKSWYSYDKVSTDEASSQLYCKYCKLYGHTIDRCVKAQYKSNESTKPKQTLPKSGKPVMNVGVHVNDLSLFSKHLYPGTLSTNGTDSDGRFKLKILRDTAALQSIMLKSAVSNVTYTGETVLITDLTATTPHPLARVHLDCPFVTSEVRVAIREKPFPMPGVQFLLGNDLAEDLQPSNLTNTDKPQVCTSVMDKPIFEYVTAEVQESDQVSPPVLATTRAQAARPPPADSTARAVPQDPQNLPPNLTKLEFRKLQREDPSLTPLFFQAETQPDSIPGFFLENELLYRRYRPSKLKEDDDWANVEQLVIPTSIRPDILHLAHGALSHYDFNKTYHGIRQDYYWPGMVKDVKKYLQQCHICQMAGKPNISIPQAPLKPIQVPAEPFHRLIIDCVGPLARTSSDNAYILTILCPTTRFTIAVPVKNITAATVVKQQLKIFTQYGFPREIQSDCGTNFTSDLFKKTLEEFNIKQISRSLSSSMSTPVVPASGLT
ncbi:uncharacterized protein [Procambarus clarkii]|uniref:uncharacterized protein n=1 Tax=Procambarus clarkii TaxID=6728 RepID=UPI0037443290